MTHERTTTPAVAPEDADWPLVHIDGCCPVCHDDGQLVFVLDDAWLVCHAHRVFWYAGRDTFTGWERQTGRRSAANRALLLSYEQVAPVCTCDNAPPLPPDLAEFLEALP